MDRVVTFPYRNRHMDRLISVARHLRTAGLLLAVVLGPNALYGQTVSGRTASGQTIAEVTSTPEGTSDLFLRSIRAIRWSTAAQFLHPETLARFKTSVTLIADADSTGEIRTFLAGTDSIGLVELGGAEVFDRAIGAVIDDMPGLMHALYDRDDDVLGYVPEGDGEAHAVYRTTARISGAVPEVKVMQLALTPTGWRVRWSDELEVLEAALRGVRR